MTTQSTHQDSLTMALKYAGGAIGLAKRINALGASIRYQSIQGWKKRGYIPPSSFAIVERATDGTVTMPKMLNDFVKAKQGITQPETPEHGTECPTRSSDAAEITALESGIITQGCPSQPIEY